MKRTQKEIVEKVNEWNSENNLFDHRPSDLIEYLEYGYAKPFLKDGVTKEEWEKGSDDIKSPKSVMIDYMPFAWQKANDCRGLSAMRTMQHYQAWLWLDGNDELSETLSDYEYYGKDHLVKICEYLGLDHTQWDDGIRTNTDG